MIPLETAQDIVRRTLAGRGPVAEAERVPLAAAAGRVLAADVASQLDLPPFDRVTMDGYAVAGGETGRRLRVTGLVRAGRAPEGPVLPGKAIKIMTGAPAPPGTGRIVPVERTREEDGAVTILDAAELAPGARRNVAPRGEDLRAGDRVARAGERLDPARLAALAAAGVTEVAVRPRPAVAVLATGDEVVTRLADRGPAGVMDANTPLLLGLLRGHGYAATAAGSMAGGSTTADSAVPASAASRAAVSPVAAVPDDPGALRAALTAALDRAEVVVLTGGVSAGDFDHVPEVLAELGFEILFRRVAVKPGKPTTFAVGERGVVFGLPGNPVSAFVTCHLYVLPGLALLEGAVRRPRFLALPLAADLAVAPSPRVQLLPARLAEEPARPAAEATGTPPGAPARGAAAGPAGAPASGVAALTYHGSGHLHALTAADGLIRVEPGVERLAAGLSVPFWPLRLGPYGEGES